MPIDTSQMLMQLSPMAPLSSGINPSGGAGAQRSQLRLARERFEEEKRQNRENRNLALLEEQGRMARQGLQAEQERAAREAEAQSKVMAEKQKAFQSFGELNAKGDIEGARAMVPFMTSLGMGVDLEGEENGLPRYRVEMDGAGALASQQLQEAATAAPAARPSDEVYGATEESATDSLARLDAATSVQDDTGDGIPKNVIDTGAIQASTLARLAPALQGAINSYPGAYQDSATKTAAGVAGMGLKATDALDTFHKLRGGPNSLIQSEIEAGAQQGRFNQTQQASKDRSANTQHERGWTAAKQAASTYNVDDLITARDQTKNAIEIINNGDPTDDHLVLSLISRRMGERGATTEGDIKRVTGIAAMSWIDQAKTWLERGLEGGFNRAQKNALVGVLKAMNESDDKRFTAYLDKIEEEAGRDGSDPERGNGMREYGRIIVPKDIREGYEAKKKGPDRQPTSGKFDAELDAQSHASGLDPDKVRGIIRPESGGDPSAVNPQSGASGLIQFLPKVAESLGSSIEEVRKMTAEQQIPLVMKYLSERGVTKDSSPGDYYMAVAAPAFIGKSDDSVVYKQGSKEWEQNPAWRPSGGGDITVGSIKAYGGGKKKGESGSGKSSRLLELLKKGGY